MDGSAECCYEICGLIYYEYHFCAYQYRGSRFTDAMFISLSCIEFSIGFDDIYSDEIEESTIGKYILFNYVVTENCRNYLPAQR